MPDKPNEPLDAAQTEPAEEGPTPFAAQFETREQAFREAQAELDWLDELA